MPYFAHHRASNSSNGTGGEDDWLAKPLQDDVSSLKLAMVDVPQFKSPEQRRNFFSGADKRKAVTFGPKVCSLLEDNFYVFILTKALQLTRLPSAGKTN